MDTLKSRILAMTPAEKDALAASAGTTRGLLNQIIYGGKHIELGLADCFVALLPGLRIDDMPLTERARRQANVRAPKKRRSSASETHAQA
ncbi:hypothetical protein GCM10007320_08960 [Pseudorhodoferax aquiterrae]|uniref:XRE family transcriptional regulator n=1 Tax=Pseudorhodoferax aquiterrae TaxID=747304 RepID=A0ABQ3FX68_9BURK|nr:hypothetical protein [Pseudorhodoferax aquiterrae]GHC72820.1 hypothetical protein GCM10007320_08960 [Pseudorhodoferax aquiterrae]